MAEVALKIVPQEEEVSREVLDINAQAKELKVATTEDYIKAGEFWKSIKALRKKVDDTFSPIISAAHAAHKTAVAKKKEVDAPLEEAERRVKRLMADYDAEQERIRREEQRRLEEESRKAAEEQALLDAIAAEEEAKRNGATQEEAAQEAAAIIEEPVYVAPVVVPKATPKLQGGPIFQERWSAEVVDIRLLCKAVAEGKASPECVTANMPVLNRMATALKSTLHIPGVRAVSRRV